MPKVNEKLNTDKMLVLMSKVFFVAPIKNPAMAVINQKDTPVLYRDITINGDEIVIAKFTNFI